MIEQIEQEIKSRLNDDNAVVKANIFENEHFLITAFWNNNVKEFRGEIDDLSSTREYKIKPWLREEMLNKQ